MKDTSDWIDGIIQDLIEPTKKLRDILLKVQILAFKIQNKKLQQWVNNELNGYKYQESPDYRIIPVSVFGNLMKPAGFTYAIRKNTVLPIEYLEPEIRKDLMIAYVNNPVSELEKMIEGKGGYTVNIPHAIYSEITELLANDWYVDSAWKKINLNSIEAVLTSIKSNLLNFLLELNKEIGEKDNYSIMKNKKKVDNLFDKTIGNISGETVNITIGDKSMQNINQGNNAKINIAKGKKIFQKLKVENKNELIEFINSLQKNLDNLGLNIEDKEDVTNEIQRIQSQLKRKEPKLEIISTALTTIHAILISIAANAYTPIVLEKISALLTKF